jgi:hypothetical protein
MFLWRDPMDRSRMLLYVSTPGGPPALQVLDVSDPENVSVVTTWDAQIDGGLRESRFASYLHSVSVSDEGSVAYLSYQAAGFFAVDTSELASSTAKPTVRTLTPIAARVDYVPPEPAGTHSAVALPGRAAVLLTDEIYPPPVGTGCPWGWMRLVDFADPISPTIASEYRLPENDPDHCPDAKGGPAATTFTAHNPTVSAHLAFVTWHAGGLQVVDTTRITSPRRLAAYVPDPLPAVALEDPMFEGNPVSMWSYPVIRKGLIYVVDVRNGLYILRYHGPYEDEIAAASLLEGNSNVR